MTAIKLYYEELTGSVIGAFSEVYNALGTGFLEHIYRKALERELRARNHLVAREVPVVVLYKGEELAVQRLDMLVDAQLIVEVKSKSDNPDAGSAQLFNYLRATNLEIGLLFNFGTKPSFKRVVCGNSSRRAASTSDPACSDEKNKDDKNNDDADQVRNQR
jgi:GxxExxY protein